MSRASEKCPLCCDKFVVPVIGRLDLAPCPRCRPAAPGRLLKALPGESKGAAELAVDMTEDVTR